MTSRPLALAAALLVLSTTGCTAQDDAASEATGGVAPSADPTETTGSGPLVLGGERTICVDLKVNDLRDFTYGRSVDDVVSTVELRSVSLVGASQVQAVEAWVIPSDGVDAVETWSGWPLPQDERARLAWDSRVPLKGARLEPGESYDLLVRTLRGTGRGVHGFDAIEVVYEADGEEHVVRDETAVEFLRGC